MTSQPTGPNRSEPKRARSKTDKERLAIRPFTASLPMTLLRAREATMCLFRPMLADHDLTEQQWRVLRALTAAPGPLEAGELADRTFLLAPSLSRILTNLESRSYIERRTHPGDQRRSLISLGNEGAALVGSVAPKSEAIYGDIEATFGRERLGRLLSELRDLTAMHNAHSEGVDYDP